MNVGPVAQTTAAFDAESSAYDAHWDDDPVGRLQRERVHAVLDAVVPAGARILDVGCGTGTDAAHLARRGCQVVGIDPSPGMIARARARCDAGSFEVGSAEHLPLGPFDAALSNFGALNACADLRPIAEALADRLVPGAPLVLVLLARVAPMELATLLRGDLRTATRRSRPTANVQEHPVPIWYHGRRDVERAFTAFTLEGRRAIGAVLPRAGSRFAGASTWLDPLDRAIGALPGLRGVGDHVVYRLRRR